MVRLQSKLQMPGNNLLLYSTKSSFYKHDSLNKKVASIHHSASNEGHDTLTSQKNVNIPKYNKLRLSLINEKKRKIAKNNNSSLLNIYDRDIKKSKSEILKKDFEMAFNNSIVKKAISSKE